MSTEHLRHELRTFEAEPLRQKLRLVGELMPTEEYDRTEEQIRRAGGWLLKETMGRLDRLKDKIATALIAGRRDEVDRLHLEYERVLDGR